MNQDNFVRNFQIDPSDGKLPIFWEVDISGLLKYLEDNGDIKPISNEEFYDLFPDFNGNVNSWSGIITYLRSNNDVDFIEFTEDNLFVIPHNESIVIMTSSNGSFVIYTPNTSDTDFIIYYVYDIKYFVQILTSIVISCDGYDYILDVYSSNENSGFTYYLSDLKGNFYGQNINTILNIINNCSNISTRIFI